MLTSGWIVITSSLLTFPLTPTSSQLLFVQYVSHLHSHQPLLSISILALSLGACQHASISTAVPKHSFIQSLDGMASERNVMVTNQLIYSKLQKVFHSSISRSNELYLVSLLVQYLLKFKWISILRICFFNVGFFLTLYKLIHLENNQS